MFRNIKANFIESLCALVILALCGWQTTKTFSLLYPDALSGKNSQFTPIKIEKSFLISNSSIENTACLGYLDGVFERTLENASYSLSGELYVAINDKMFPTKVDLEASFNVLGQLAAAVLKLSNASANLTLGLLNVDPIEISLLSSIEGQTSKREKINVPGPILLKESLGKFILDYSPAGQTIALDIEAYPIESILALKLDSSPEAKSKCIAGNKAAIDLLGLSNRLRNKLGAFLPQLPIGNLMDIPS